MTEQSPDGKFLKIVGLAIVSAVGAAIGWLTGGSGNWAIALTTISHCCQRALCLPFSLMYRRHIGVLASGGARCPDLAKMLHSAYRGELDEVDIPKDFRRCASAY